MPSGDNQSRVLWARIFTVFGCVFHSLKTIAYPTWTRSHKPDQIYQESRFEALHPFGKAQRSSSCILGALTLTRPIRATSVTCQGLTPSLDSFETPRLLAVRV